MDECILPGAVSQVLAVSQWNEYDIVVYKSEFGEIIISSDLALLEVLSLPPPAQPAMICASFNAENGNIAISTGMSLVLFEAIEVFGHPPRWELAFHATDVPATSTSWVDKDHLAAITSGNECLIWSASELRIVWLERLTCPSGRQIRLDSVPGTGSFVTHDSGPLVKLWRQRASKEALSFDFVYLPHTTDVLQCWFVSPTVLATVNSSALFLWQVTSGSILASTPLPRNTCRPLVLSASGGLLVIQAGSENFWGLELKNDGSPPQLSKQDIDISLASISENNIFTTTRRIYSRPKGATDIKIYRYDSHGVSSVGCLTGVSNGGEALSSHKNVILAGSTFFTRTQRSGSIPIDQKSVLALITSKYAVIVTDDNTLLCFKDKYATWKLHLHERPFDLTVNDQVIVLVFFNKVLLVDITTGTEISEKTIKAELACAYGSRVLVWSHRHLSLWNASSPLLEQVMEYSIQDDEDLEATALSITDTLAVGSFRESRTPNTSVTLLRIWRTSDTFTELASVDLGSVEVQCMRWSHDKTFLAVLTSKKLLTFVVTRSHGLVQIGEYETWRLAPTMVAWMDDLSIVLFNGRQLMFRAPMLDNFGRNVLRRLGFDENDLSLQKVSATLSADLPIYHPKTIYAFVLALKPSLASCVFSKLCKDLRFADISADGVYVLDSTLGLSVTELSSSNMASSSWPMEELDERLGKSQLICLSDDETKLLQQLARTLDDAMKKRHVDEYALAYMCLQLLGSKEAISQARVYAWFSSTKPELLSSLDALSDPNVAFWLDRPALAEVTEQRAKARFAQEREPTTVTLPYVALRKKDVLLTLWRISSGHPEREKTLKFLNNDFTNERWRVASYKNAYALLSKHRPEYAAAFFLLGDSVIDCCQVLVSKLNNIELAVAVARLYDGDSGKGMRTLSTRWFENDVWLTLWCGMQVNPNKKEVLDNFLATTMSDPLAIFIYADQGGQFNDETKTLWKDALKNCGFSSVVRSILVDSLEAKAPPEPNTEGQQETTEDHEGSGVDSTQGSKDVDDLENRPLPANLKPAPTELQLEPDMSAFGF